MSQKLGFLIANRSWYSSLKSCCWYTLGRFQSFCQSNNKCVQFYWTRFKVLTRGTFFERKIIFIYTRGYAPWPLGGSTIYALLAAMRYVPLRGALVILCYRVRFESFCHFDLVGTQIYPPRKHSTSPAVMLQLLIVPCDIRSRYLLLVYFQIGRFHAGRAKNLNIV